MSNVGGYPTRSFSESQKFFVLDPSTGTSSLVLGADIVEYITPIINGVAAETTRLSAESTDYDIGNIIQTSGALEIGDSLASVYLVVASGDGDFPMINGNELLVITGDDSIREQLISEVAGEGASLVSMEGGPSVEVAVLDRVIRVTSIADMESYSVPVGYVFSLNAGGRSGTFDVVAGDFSADLAADTENGIYIGLADNPTATTKVAKRRGSDTDVSFAFFGELGSGDDALLLQAAFDFIEFKGGGTVRAEVEKINWQTQVKMPSNTHFLVGEKTVITRGAAINNMLVNNSDGSIGGYSANSNMTVTGGIWDANSVGFPSECTSLAFGHSSNVEVRNSTFKNTPVWHCVEYNGVLRGKVINCNFSDCDLLDNAEAIQIDLMLGAGQFPWFGPYDGSPCADIVVTGCTFYSVGSGIGSHSADATKKHIGILIESNFFTDIEYTAVKCLNYSGVKVLNNRIENARYGITAVTVSGAVNSDYLVSGNTLFNIKKDAVNSRGIHIDGDNATDRRIRDVVVSNNFVKEIGNHGIGLDFLLHCTVSGNISQRARRIGIWIYGCSEFTVTGNQAIDNDVEGGASDIRIGVTGSQNTIGGAVVGNSANSILVNNTSGVLVRQNTATAYFTASANASGSFNENLVAGVLN